MMRSSLSIILNSIIGAVVLTPFVDAKTNLTRGEIVVLRDIGNEVDTIPAIALVAHTWEDRVPAQVAVVHVVTIPSAVRRSSFPSFLTTASNVVTYIVIKRIVALIWSQESVLEVIDIGKVVLRRKLWC
jgi:hypothetical protein